MKNKSSKTGTPHQGYNKYDQRQADILSFSAKVIAKEGYEKASIRRIAAEMGMSISALYYYFESKEELLFSIQYSSFMGLVEKLEQKLEGVEDPEQRLYLLIENHLDHFLSRINELIICSHEINTLTGEAYQVVFKLRLRYFQTALKIIDALKEKHEGTVLQTSLAALNLFGMLNWIYMWYDPKKNPSAKEMAEEIYSLFFNGIKSRSRKSPVP